MSKIRDGVYFIHPEGAAWVAAEFRGGVFEDAAYQEDAETHAASGDEWAGVVPTDDDVELTCDEAFPIIRATCSDDTDVSMVVVTRRAPQYTLVVRDETGSP